MQAGNHGFFQEDQQGVRLPIMFKAIVGVALELVQGNQDLFQNEGELSVLFPCSRIGQDPLEI